VDDTTAQSIPVGDNPQATPVPPVSDVNSMDTASVSDVPSQAPSTLDSLTNALNELTVTTSPVAPFVSPNEPPVSSMPPLSPDVVGVPASPILSDALPPEQSFASPPPIMTSPAALETIPPVSETPIPPSGPPSSGEVFLPPPPPPTAVVTGTPAPSSGGQSKIFLIAGAILVLAVAAVGGFFVFTHKASSPQAEIPVVTPVPTKAIPLPLTLSISEPQDGVVVSTGEVVVSGRAAFGSVVVIVSSMEQVTSEVDAAGTFTSTVKLAPGMNTLSIVATDSTGAQKRENRIVIYDN